MPKDLFAAFRATFEEAQDANLLLELVDASDEEERAHKQETEKLIRELGLEEVPKLRVYNKADRLERLEPALVEALGQEQDSLVISALDAQSLRPLISAIERRFRPPKSA
jgi:GTP-binding protein HflX